MSTRLHIVVSDATVADIDVARGDVPRSAWVRRLIMLELFGRGAVERALGDEGRFATGGSCSPAPAEQPEQPRGRETSEAERRGLANFAESASRPAREFRPYPKGGG